MKQNSSIFELIFILNKRKYFYSYVSKWNNFFKAKVAGEFTCFSRFTLSHQSHIIKYKQHGESLEANSIQRFCFMKLIKTWAKLSNDITLTGKLINVICTGGEASERLTKLFQLLVFLYFAPSLAQHLVSRNQFSLNIICYFLSRINYASLPIC